jgi:hypothetical protein
MSSDGRPFWNYRVTLTRYDDESMFEVREIYYGPEGELSWTVDPVSPHGSTWMEFNDALGMMVGDCAGASILDITDPENPVWVDRRGNPRG